MQYVDLHCDTLTCGKWLPKEIASKHYLFREETQISLEKLKKGECLAQVFAIFSRSVSPNSWRFTEEKVQEFIESKKFFEGTGITPILSIEDGGSVEGDLSRVEFLLDKGVRIFGLTWNDENCIGSSCWTGGKLKPFGKKLVEYLLERKVYPDLSHLSDEGIEETLEIAKTARFPVMATHSLSRTVEDHKRNLLDAHIKKIADLGGVIGVNFAPDFVGEAGIISHIEHILDVGGEDVLAIGSDFDGIESPIYPSAEDMPTFFKDLEGMLTERQIEKLAYQNAKRLLL